MSKIGTQKIANCEYAPGIATYGVNGKDGGDGVNGTTLFISVYNINDDTDAGNFGTAVLRGLNMTDRSEKKIQRDYIDGDLFLFQDGSIWKLDDVDGLKNASATGQITGQNGSSGVVKEYMSHSGNIQSSSDSGFTTAGKFLILDSANYKGFVIDNTGNSAASLTADSHTAPFTIISNEQDNDNVIRFMSLKSMFAGKSDTSFNIYYDSDNNAWVLNSDKPVLFDCDVKFCSDGKSGDFDEYSTPLLNDTPMTRFYALCRNKIRYSMGKIEEKQTTSSRDSQKRLMSSYSIYAPKNLEYDINGNLMEDSQSSSRVITIDFHKGTSSDSSTLFTLADFVNHALKITVLYDGNPVKNSVELSNWVNVPRDDQDEKASIQAVYLKRVSGSGADIRYVVAVNMEQLLNGITKDEHISIGIEWSMNVFQKQVVVPLDIPLVQNRNSRSTVPFVFHMSDDVAFDEILNMTIHIVNYDKSGVMQTEYYAIITDSMKNDYTEEHELNFNLDVNQSFDKDSVWSVSLIDAIEIKLCKKD